jgi:hypothetical protein
MSYKIFDMEEDEDFRLTLIQGESEFSDSLDLISRLIAIHEIADTSLMRNFMRRIVLETKVHILLKAELTKALCNFESGPSRDTGKELLELILPECNTELIPLPNRVELCVLLMELSDKTNPIAKREFESIVCNNQLSSEYRYKIILSIERRLGYVIDCMRLFISTETNAVRYRILAGQFLYTHSDSYGSEYLLSIARSTSYDVNVRADSADVLLQFGDETYKRLAKEVIRELGRIDGPVLTLFNNAQNVHTVEIEESVNSILEKLHETPIPPSVTLEVIEREYTKEGTNSKEDIELAINRIRIDRAIYGKFSLTLHHILLLVWTYIQSKPEETRCILTKRLGEELVEMAGTCSSGYSSRIVNTLSGFDDFTIRISWRDQIIGNLNGRLNALIRNMDNLDLQEKILEEMTISTSKYEERAHFLDFFRDNVLSIRDEMHAEFREYMDDTTFDLYFRQSISNYESGDWN